MRPSHVVRLRRRVAVPTVPRMPAVIEVDKAGHL